MVYLQEDFYSTLTGTKDPNSRKEQIYNAIADLVAFNKADVIEALNASGVLTPSNASTEKVAEAIAKNAGDNKKLQLGLAYLITQKNYPEPSSSASGNTTFGVGDVASKVGGDTAAGASAGGPWGAIVGAVAGVVDSIFSAKAAKENRIAAQEEHKTQILQLAMQKLGGGDSKKGLYIGLGIAAVLLTVLVVVLIKRKK